VCQGRNDILIVAIGTKKHPSCVRIVGFGVGVRQYFGSTPRSSTSMSQEIMKELVGQLA